MPVPTYRAVTFVLVLFASALPRAHSQPSQLSAAPKQDSAVRTPQSKVTKLPNLRLLDTTGKSYRLDTPGNQVTVVTFLSSECPISNRYIPELNRLAQDPAMRDRVRWLGVISDDAVCRDDAAKFHTDYRLEFPLLFDGSGELARALKPTHTPETFVFGPRGQLVYRGRIDNRYADVTTERRMVTRHDLQEAVRAALKGNRPRHTRTAPVGCLWEPPSRPTGGDITYCRDVAPILFQHCAPCHHPGEVAPFSLLTYKDAAKRAKWLASVAQQHIMPPWSAAPDYGHFINERRLSEEEIQLLKEWSESGTPYGDESDMPVVPEFPKDWKLGTPDLVLELPGEFHIPAGGPDIYQYFVLPIELDDDRWVQAVEFRPGNPRVVHHAILFLDSRQAARKLDAADPGLGYQRFGGPGFLPSGGIGGWAPGMGPIQAPAGSARRLPTNSDLVLQIHYHPSGKPERDRSRVGIYFAKQPPQRFVGGVALLNRNFVIPAGAKNHEVRASFTLPCEVTATSVTPHMHLRGKQMKVTATLPDQSQVPLIWITKWDWNWQLRYEFAQPLTLPKGTRLDLVATYDNSADNPANPVNPPIDVRWGDETEDEMCLCFVEMIVPDMAHLHQLRRAMLLQQVAKDPFVLRRFLDIRRRSP